jgi:2',3'-cyclic-nucleotide 2'-phosphodiesterase (5'-nucleotidase family)
VEPFFDPDISRESLVGGLAQVGTAIKDEKQKNPDGTMLLSAGDMASGSLIGDSTYGASVAAALKPMGFDVIGLGNHEFRWGTGHLKNILEQIDSPVVAANVIQGQSGEVIDGAVPFVIKEVNGVQVGVIGLDTRKTEAQTPPELLGNVHFLDASETLHKYLPLMKAQGAEMLVVLSHLGLNGDERIARDFKDESLIIVGGHSHTILPAGQKEENSFIVQAGAYSRHLGRLDINWDDSEKKITGTRASLIPIVADQIQPDSEIQQVLQPYLDALSQQGGNEVMGTAAEDLFYTRSTGGKLNQIQADSMMEASGTELAISPCMSIQRNLKKGPAEKKTLYDCMPYADWQTISMKTKGSNIKAMLESGLRDGARIQIPAGFKYSYDSSCKEQERVKEITLPDGSPLKMDKEYSVAVPDFVAKNKIFQESTDRKTLGLNQQIFFEYFKSACPPGGWKNDPDDRIACIGPKAGPAPSDGEL